MASGAYAHIRIHTYTRASKVISINQARTGSWFNNNHRNDSFGFLEILWILIYSHIFHELSMIVISLGDINRTLAIHWFELGLCLLCLKFYLLFFPEFPKNFAHYSFDHYLLFS